MRRFFLLICAIFCLTLSACKKETIEPELQETKATTEYEFKVTNAVVGTTAETSVTFDFQTTPVTTVSVDIPVYSGYEEQEAEETVAPFEQSEKENFTFVDLAVDNITRAEGVLKSKSNKIGFCDVDLNGVPEVLIIDNMAETDNTIVYDLKTMEPVCTLHIDETTEIIKMDSPVSAWYVSNYTTAWRFNKNRQLDELFRVYTNEEEGTETFYVNDVEVDVETFNELYPTLVDYNSVDMYAEVIYCTKDITPETFDNINQLLSNAISTWCANNVIPDVEVLL